MRLRRIWLNKTQVFSYALFVLSGAILVASIMLTMNVTVLKDWSIKIPTSEIHAGDTVTLVSQYTKIRDVSGKSVRYIECQNNHKDYIRYPLNEAVANRQRGSGGTGIVVQVPDSIPNIPTTCKFTINIVYDVYPWRKVSVTQSTQTFQLLPKRDVSQEVSVGEQPSTQTNPSPTVSTTAGQNLKISSSSSNPTPQQPAALSNTSQPEGSPSAPEQQLAPTPQPTDDRNTLGRLPLIGGLFNSLGL